MRKKPGRPKGSKNKAKIVTKGPTERSSFSLYSQGYVDGFIAAKEALNNLSLSVQNTVGKAKKDTLTQRSVSW